MDFENSTALRTEKRLTFHDNKVFDDLFKEMELPKRDNQKKQTALNCILANLVYAHGVNNTLAIHRNRTNYKQTRYTPKFYGHSIMIPIYNKLLELGYIRQLNGFYDKQNPKESKCSRIIPTNKLLTKLPQCNLSINLNEEETVFLSTKDEDTKLKHIINYKDTRKIITLRKKINKYNKYILDNSIVLNTDNIKSLNTFINTQDHNTLVTRNEKGKYLVPISSTVKAIFCRGNFRSGGRLYTGTKLGVQNIQSELRNDIQINQIETAEYDFKSLHTTMLYHKEGIDFQGDAYDIGEDKSIRPFLKKLTLIAINAKTEQKTVNAVLQEIRNGNIKDTWGFKKVDILYFLDKIKTKHKPISKYFCSDYGVCLQCFDGQIMLDILLTALSHNIVALPIHDSVLVQECYEEEIMQIMRNSYYRLMKFNIEVEKK